MPIMIHDEALAAVMARATEPQDVLGPAGRLLGQFIPAPTPAMCYPEFGLTNEELEADFQRMLNDPNIKWHSPEDVMARLREIDKCSP